jgi:hypothetical protein
LGKNIEKYKQKGSPVNVFLSIFRFTIVILIVSKTFDDNSVKISYIRGYSNSISQLMKFNGEMIDLFATILYPSAIPDLELLRKKFEKTSSGVKQYNKMQII